MPTMVSRLSTGPPRRIPPAFASSDPGMRREVKQPIGHVQGLVVSHYRQNAHRLGHEQALCSRIGAENSKVGFGRQCGRRYERAAACVQ